jgi:hypothetical protein
VRRRRLADWANRPIGGDPLARAMRQHCRQIDDPGGLIDGGGLHHRDFMLAQGIAHDVEASRQRRIAEYTLSFVGIIGADRSDEMPSR